MRIATDDPVAVSQFVSITWLRCAKTAERIAIMCGVETLGNKRHIALDEGFDSPTTRKPVSVEDFANKTNRCGLCQIISLVRKLVVFSSNS